MAKPVEHLKQTPKLPYKNPDERECPCGCGTINRNEHVYIESRTTGHWYSDINCLIAADGAQWEGERIRDDFGTLYSLEQYKRVMEVVSHG